MVEEKLVAYYWCLVKVKISKSHAKIHHKPLKCTITLIWILDYLTSRPNFGESGSRLEVCPRAKCLMKLSKHEAWIVEANYGWYSTSNKGPLLSYFLIMKLGWVIRRSLYQTHAHELNTGQVRYSDPQRTFFH